MDGVFMVLFPTFYHFDGSHGAFVAFVTKHSAAAFLCLFEGVAGKQAIDDGHLTLAVQVGKPLGCSLTDIVEVGRVAANDAADGYDGIHQTRVDETRSAIYKFETARDGLDFNVLFPDTMLH